MRLQAAEMSVCRIIRLRVVTLSTFSRQATRVLIDSVGTIHRSTHQPGAGWIESVTILNSNETPRSPVRKIVVVAERKEVIKICFEGKVE